jgi:hypothetical protein
LREPPGGGGAHWATGWESKQEAKRKRPNLKDTLQNHEKYTFDPIYFFLDRSYSKSGSRLFPKNQRRTKRSGSWKKERDQWID